jgi:hypothetical protein
VIRHNDIVIDRKTCTIAVGAKSFCFRFQGSTSIVGKSPRFAFHCISHMLLKGHVTSKDLFDRGYGHLENGGPDSLPRPLFAVHLCHWKKYFKALGIVLKSDKRAGIMHYHLARQHD